MIALLVLQLVVAPGVFHRCGLEGKAVAARVRPLNLLKNRSTTPRAVDAAITFERLAAPGDDRDRWSVNQAATITGLVVEVKPGGLESVNCGAKDLPFRDTHIGIAVDQAHAKTPVIVEVTPRWRAAEAEAGVDWSTAALKRQLLGHQVTITGWLFRDDEHLQNAVNTNPHGSTLWRQTVWELHPVTAIACLDPACTPRGESAGIPGTGRDSPATWLRVYEGTAPSFPSENRELWRVWSGGRQEARTPDLRVANDLLRGLFLRPLAPFFTLATGREPHDPFRRQFHGGAVLVADDVAVDPKQRLWRLPVADLLDGRE